MSLTTSIILVLALYVVQIFLQETSRFGFDVRGIVGNRDHPPEISLTASRLERAKNNMQEALPLFLGLSLLALARVGDTGVSAQAATVFLVARVVYVPAYVSGLPWFRSIVWLVGMGSLAVMAVQVLTVHGAA